jgi:hypothetical protein
MVKPRSRGGLTLETFRFSIELRKVGARKQAKTGLPEISAVWAYTPKITLPTGFQGSLPDIFAGLLPLPHSAPRAEWYWGMCCNFENGNGGWGNFPTDWPSSMRREASLVCSGWAFERPKWMPRRLTVGTGAFADQAPFKLGDARKHGHDQLASSSCGVGPGLGHWLKAGMLSAIDELASTGGRFICRPSSARYAVSQGHRWPLNQLWQLPRADETILVVFHILYFILGSFRELIRNCLNAVRGLFQLVNGSMFFPFVLLVIH